MGNVDVCTTPGHAGCKRCEPGECGSTSECVSEWGKACSNTQNCDGDLVCVLGRCEFKKEEGENSSEGGHCESGYAGYWKYGQASKRCCPEGGNTVTGVAGVASDPYCTKLGVGKECSATQQCESPRSCSDGVCKGRRATPPPSLTKNCGTDPTPGCKLILKKEYVWDQDKTDSENMTSMLGNPFNKASVACRDASSGDSYLKAKDPRMAGHYEGEGWVVAECIDDPSRAKLNSQNYSDCYKDTTKNTKAGVCLSDWKSTETELEQNCKEVAKAIGVTYLPSWLVGYATRFLEKRDDGKIRTICNYKEGNQSRVGWPSGMCDESSGGECWMEMKEGNDVSHNVTLLNKEFTGKAFRKLQGSTQWATRHVSTSDGRGWRKDVKFAKVVTQPPQTDRKCDSSANMKGITNNVLAGGSGWGTTCVTTKEMCTGSRPCWLGGAENNNHKAHCGDVNKDVGGPYFKPFMNREPVKTNPGHGHGDYTYECVLDETRNNTSTIRKPIDDVECKVGGPSQCYVPLSRGREPIEKRVKDACNNVAKDSGSFEHYIPALPDWSKAHESRFGEAYVQNEFQRFEGRDVGGSPVNEAARCIKDPSVIDMSAYPECNSSRKDGELCKAVFRPDDHENWKWVTRAAGGATEACARKETANRTFRHWGMHGVFYYNETPTVKEGLCYTEETPDYSNNRPKHLNYEEAQYEAQHGWDTRYSYRGVDAWGAAGTLPLAENHHHRSNEYVLPRCYTFFPHTAHAIDNVCKRFDCGGAPCKRAKRHDWISYPISYWKHGGKYFDTNHHYEQPYLQYNNRPWNLPYCHLGLPYGHACRSATWCAWAGHQFNVGNDWFSYGNDKQGDDYKCHRQMPPTFTYEHPFGLINRRRGDWLDDGKINHMNNRADDHNVRYGDANTRHWYWPASAYVNCKRVVCER